MAGRLPSSSMASFLNSCWTCYRPLILGIALYCAGAVVLESIGSIAIMLVTFSFLYNFMHIDAVTAASSYNYFLGTAYMLALPAGYITDSYLSKFTTIIIAGLLEILGYAMLTVSSIVSKLHPPSCPPYSSLCKKPTMGQKAFFFSGLYIFAAGMGGLRPNLPTLGADQFDENDPEQRKCLPSYFNWFYFAVCFGGMFGATLLTYLFEEVSWAWGFGVCTAAIAVGLIIIISGYKQYKVKTFTVSPLTKIAQVCVASFHNRKLPEPSSDTLYGKDQESWDKTLYTAQFRCLDKAAIGPSKIPDKNTVSDPWRLCQISQVEETKAIFRVVPMFAATIMQSCVFAQLQTFTMQQAETLDRRLPSGFKVPPASISIISIATSLILLPFYDRCFVPFACWITGHERGITHLQRIGSGIFLTVICTVVAALVEIKRIGIAKRHHLLDNPGATIPMSVFWLALQGTIFGVSELFTNAGLLDFFYAESPESMHSMATSLISVSGALGLYTSGVVVTIVNSATHHTWLPQFNINHSKLMDFYWLLSVVGFINFCIYLAFAKWFKGKAYYRELQIRNTFGHTVPELI